VDRKKKELKSKNILILTNNKTSIKMNGLPSITREQVAEKIRQGRADDQTYFFLLISTTRSSPISNYPRIVETALTRNNQGDWKKVSDLPNVRFYFGHFLSRDDAADNRLINCNLNILQSIISIIVIRIMIKRAIKEQAENASPHLILSETFNYLPENEDDESD
jgi:hypothetical protein